jgi:choline kinase
MSRFTRKIKQKPSEPVEVIILGAGVGARIKSYEPRSLIKIRNKALIDYQIELINKYIPKNSITLVVGYDANKIIKKVYGRVKIVENQIYNESNSAESLRLAVNNSSIQQAIVMHGDLYFEDTLFNYFDFRESFILTSSLFNQKEVGVTIVDGYATIFSYSLITKWAQIVFLAEKELNILRRIYLKDEDMKYNLTFEMLNKIIEGGGKFKAIDIKNSYIKEIDTIKDITDENTNRH